MSARLPALRRRALLAAGGLALAGCGRGAPTAAAVGVAMAGMPGGWLGAAVERGHLLRGEPPAVAEPGPARRCAVAIVGGGVAGLAAARALLRAGIDDLRLFELEDEAGGNARGHRMDGLDCPQGAHYLPLPGPQAREVAEWLHEIGLLRHELGRSVPDERHLCHSPQERLWVDGQWLEGTLPPAERGSTREAQYRRFSQRVAAISRELPFAIPSHRAGWTAGHASLDAQTFAQWLQAEGFDDAGLRWYLDYACRDDYGGDAAAVSAWAGLHYFASRHGFQAEAHGEGEDAAEAVFTWPEGNAWLTRRLAAPLGERLHGGALVHRIEAGRHEVQIELRRWPGPTAERWTARQVVLALPLHVAARVVATPPPGLREAAARVATAPWLVANLRLRAALTDKPGAPPSWDNVLYDPQASAPTSLGYVDATHQRLRPTAGPTVLTAYHALGSADAALLQQRRRALLDEPWTAWAARVLEDLSRAHPDLPAKTLRIDLSRHGHAMAMPRPGVRGDAALRALASAAADARLHLAHADLAGYSIFEEAFTFGDAAGREVARRLQG